MMTLKPKQVAEWSGRIIDVREPDEFAAERLPRAECVPLGRLAAAVSGWERGQSLLIVCRTGRRATQAVQQLEADGFTGVSLLEGGVEACKREGVEVIVDRKRIPLYRQVMIVAGLLLLAGLVLSHVHPWLIAVDWLVAAGLTFAGITGYCPMAKLLERMPWNALPCCSDRNCT